MAAVKFAQGTPFDVRRVIDGLLAETSLDSRLVKCIERLAGDQAMGSLWQSAMPAALLDAAPMIITYTIAAFAEANSLPKTKAQVLAWRVADSQMAGLAVVTRHLQQDLRDAAGRLRPAWSNKLTLDDLLASLTDLAGLCDRLNADTGSIRALFPEPPRKLGSKTAPEVYFMRAMKGLFQKAFGQPYAKIVATITQVAFDLVDAVDESRVLKV